MAFGARHATLGLLVVLLIAGLLRVPDLPHSPPGLNQDEACNAWNAYCLLKTGRDQFGERWPVFYMRALGEYRSTLFAYFMLPFQAVGGLNIWTTRLPAAAGGLLTVLLMYWVGARLFGRLVGLLAAALLAIDPTHIQLTRWGHEASIGPLLTLLPIAALLWAGFPLGDDAPRPRIWRAVVAGLVVGGCCYGYPAARLYVPVFLTCAALVDVGAWWGLIRAAAPQSSIVNRQSAIKATPLPPLPPGGGGRDIISAIGLIVGIAVTFGPLAYKHITEPDIIGRRGQNTWMWSPEDPFPQRVGNVLARYAEHFGPDFLYRYGDVYDIIWTNGVGFLPLALIVCAAAGVVLCVPRWRSSRAARLLILSVVLYPAGDCINWHAGPNGLRSAVGLWGLMLASAYAIRYWPPLLARYRLPASTLGLGVALGFALVVQEVHFLQQYFVKRRADWKVYYASHADLLAACDWLRPRLASFDAVIITPIDFNQPYLIVLVGLGYDPQRWFAEPREWQPFGEWDRWTRYGKFYFAHAHERPAILAQLQAEGEGQRVLFILREREAPPGEPVHRIIGPDGKVALVIYDVRP